jgi:hypothetical protein
VKTALPPYYAANGRDSEAISAFDKEFDKVVNNQSQPDQAWFDNTPKLVRAALDKPPVLYGHVFECSKLTLTEETATRGLLSQEWLYRPMTRRDVSSVIRARQIGRNGVRDGDESAPGIGNPGLDNSVAAIRVLTG